MKKLEKIDVITEIENLQREEKRYCEEYCKLNPADKERRAFAVPFWLFLEPLRLITLKGLCYPIYCSKRASKALLRLCNSAGGFCWSAPDGPAPGAWRFWNPIAAARF